MILKCNKCKREWEYKGASKFYASCPQCLNKVKVIDQEGSQKSEECT